MKTDLLTQTDDCDQIVGSSTNDRKGCIDSDSDGWSDTDSGWDVQNGADAFENDGTQWRDRDFDGYGDNILGNQPDHCPDNRGYSTDDRYGCIDSDADGFSDADPGGLDGLEPWYAHPDGLADSFPYESSQWRYRWLMALEIIGMILCGTIHTLHGVLENGCFL